MPLTKSFNQTTKPLLRQDPAFRRDLLANAVSTMLAGDLDTGKSILRMYINGTVGFIRLAAALNRNPKVLMRILSPAGNPQARLLFEVLAHLQKLDGVTLKASAIPAPQSVST